MRTVCPYCEYKKPDEPLSLDIMKQVFESEDIIEDFILWMDRLLKHHHKIYGFTSYNGIKVHIGRKHKGLYNSPMHILNKQELDLLKNYEKTK